MSLSSSLYSGTSGLKNTSNALQVTSNNISNTSTVGFKKGQSTFADAFYQTVGTQSGAAQVGLGTAIDNVSQNFSEGSLEGTGNATDLAIGGDGFFVVSQPGTDEVLYTRAGNFSFDESGALITPGGYIVQGWAVDESGDQVGNITDLVLKEFTSPPDKTTEAIVITNLDAESKVNNTVLSNGYGYEEGEDTTVRSDFYAYPTVVTVYDSLGAAHDLTVYYDKKSDTEWEYMIVSNPEEDNRNLVAGTSSQGLLARGTIEFSESSGKIVNMTMEEFTGRVGNVKTTGGNSVDDVHFEIEDSQAMLLDGYGIEMSYDGNEWVLDKSSLPDTYKNAEILYSDDQNIYLVLDPSSSGGAAEADLKIRVDQYAFSGDTIRFDINNPTDLHEQDLDVSTIGKALSNMETKINDPGVITRSAENCAIIWNPATSTWQWSNPTDAADAGTLVSGMATNALATAVNTSETVMDIINAGAMTKTLGNASLRYDARTGEWDWNAPLTAADFTDQTIVPENGATPEIVDPGNEGAIATLDNAGNPVDVVLSWNGTAWSVSGGGTMTVDIIPAQSDATQVEFRIYDNNVADAAIVRYSFDPALSATDPTTISFKTDPAPPAEYAGAEIIGTANNSVAIDFDGDAAIDLEFDVRDGASTPLIDGNTFTFSVDPDVPPAEYANATLKGDDTRAVIDLDGSGNEDDREDIVFTLDSEVTDPLTRDSAIRFDIEGSSVWREVSRDEAEDTGYFQFTTDFLGGEFGATETDISFNIGTQYDGNNWVNDSQTTTQWKRPSYTVYNDADGYPPGDLKSVEVLSDGTMIGKYSNDQQIALFKIALADFNNVNGLHSEGGNLYSETQASGAAVTNTPGQNGLGELKSYNLEMSNVDISEEFVELIELQNAYEANAKIISTVDEMMTTVIQMKR